MNQPASIMMVTYNRLDLTKETLDIIKKNTKYPFNLILIDNGSKDGTPAYLKSFCEEHVGKGSFVGFKIHCNEENQGIAIGRNQGLLLAQDEWLATIDNDVWVPEGWLQDCISILEANPAYASIGVNMENRLYPMISRGGYEFQNKPQGNLGTACMVFNRKLHKLLGYFNHVDYGKYGEEDADWGMRIRTVGLKLGYLKENGRHVGEGERDVGAYREFKTASHKNNLAKFNHNCRAYMSRQKPIYIPFKDEQIV